MPLSEDGLMIVAAFNTMELEMDSRPIEALKEFAEYRALLYQRNEWFIRVRFFAIVAFLLFILSTTTIVPLTLSIPQLLLLFVILGLLLLANFGLGYALKRIETDKKSDQLHIFSLTQIGLDLSALALIVYATGGIESPFLYLFLFHIIFSGLLLPFRTTITLAILIIVSVAMLSLLELNGVIRHLSLGGLYPGPLYNNSVFLISALLTFSFVISISVLLTSIIGRDFHEMQTKLLTAFSNLEAAEKQKQRYVLAVIHEIKTPLTAVSSILHLVADKLVGDIPDAIVDRLRRALTRNDEAVSLTNTVLKISRLRLLDEKNEEPCDIEAIIGGLLNKLHPVIEDKTIEVSSSRGIGGAYLVQGDSFLLSLAFSNVIQNAIKYTPAGGELRVSLDIKETSRVEIRISDNGIGIPAEEIPLLFRDFFRAKAAIERQIEGSGVGLAVVKQIIEQHNGSIQVTSPSDFGTVENPGTTITIQLPASLV